MRRIPLFLLPLLLLTVLVIGQQPAGATTPTGRLTFYESDLVEYPTSPVVSPDGMVWLANAQGHPGILRFNPTTGQFRRWAAPNDAGSVYDLARQGTTLWFAVHDGVGSFDTVTKTFEVFHDDDVDHAQGTTVGPDGNIWFVGQESDNVNRLSVSTGVIGSYPVANLDKPTDLYVGPDGLLWFNSVVNGRLGRFNTSNLQGSTFPVAGVNFPGNFTTGPDGWVWFSSNGNDTIYRIDPGDTSEFDTFVDDDGELDAPTGLAWGPDGQLWFTSRNNDRIGRLNRFTGEISMFAAGPGILDTPENVFDGPGDDLWFVDYDHARVARMLLPHCAGRVATVRLALGDGASQGNDVIVGTPQGETIVGLGGNDRVCGAGGADDLLGMDGADVLEGGGGNDLLRGGAQRDTLRGGPGRDRLWGQAQRDRCEGGPQPDTARSCEVEVSIP
jgi:virginiamycin B lyase